MTKLFVSIGGICGALAVVLGAFGAHALKNRLSVEMLEVYQTAVQYHFYHALGLVLIGAVAISLPQSILLKWAGFIMLGGIVLFSGSLYGLALTNVKALGAVTPVGGLCFIGAWLLMAIAALKT